MSGADTKDVVKRDFAGRLQNMLNERGWSQTDLARRASAISNKTVSRDRISKYATGKALPTGPMLTALAKALDVPAQELVPSRPGGVIPTSRQPLDVKDMGGGMARLTINQPVEWPVALKILELLRGEAAPDTAD